jgi:hypothetical protein
MGNFRGRSVSQLRDRSACGTFRSYQIHRNVVNTEQEHLCYRNECDKDVLVWKDVILNH